MLESIAQDEVLAYGCAVRREMAIYLMVIERMTQLIISQKIVSHHDRTSLGTLQVQAALMTPAEGGKQHPLTTEEDCNFLCLGSSIYVRYCEIPSSVA